MAGVDLEKAKLNGALLKGAEASGAIFTSADMENANLEGASLQGANLSRANLEGVNFAGAKMQWADLAYYWEEGDGYETSASDKNVLIRKNSNCQTPISVQRSWKALISAMRI